MTDKTETFTRAQLDASESKGHLSGKAVGLTEGVKAERTRISAILGSEEAKGRTSMAQHLAFESDMSADSAKALLAKSPAEAQGAKGDGGFSEAMSKVDNPKVGADANGDQSDDAKATALAGSIVGLYTGKTKAA